MVLLAVVTVVVVSQDLPVVEILLYCTLVSLV